ncbi:MAG: hypothetical protein FWC96_00200 [Oscillospiraceae bacterium]|nr:hypothetical protein [Oscillospiraceae bacterium]
MRQMRASPEGERVRTAIDSDDLELAEEILRSFLSQNAEWHFLQGRVCYNKGWLDDSMQYFKAAVEMEPDNKEYTKLLLLMEHGGETAYRRPPVRRKWWTGEDTAECVGCAICGAASEFFCN